MMKKKTVCLLTLTITSAFLLGGCSLAEKVPGYELIYGSEKYESVQTEVNSSVEEAAVTVLLTAKEAITYAEQAGTYSVSELRMLSLEYKLDNEGLTEAEYGELATLYEELGFIKCERDILELAYRLFGNEEIFNKLQDISVNLAEEDDSIVAEMNLLLYDLSTEERLAEVVHTIESDEWIAAMMPRLGVGKRTYFREKNGAVDFSVEVGYNEACEYEAVIKYLPNGSLGDTTGLIIVRSEAVIKVYEEVGEITGSINDIGSEAGDKTFVLKTIDTDAGTVRTEEGTVKGGKFTGEYKVTIAQAASKSESESKASAFDLYNNCETLPAEVYTGEFDEDGATTLEEPSAKNIKAFADSMSAETVVVYAYNEGKTKCLYKGLTNAEKEAGVKFGTAEFSFPESHEIQYYDVKDKNSYSLEGIIKIANGAGSEGSSANSTNGSSTEPASYISAENLKVRIYGGEIQVYNGYAWISMGDAKEIAEADPFEKEIAGTDGGADASQTSGSNDNKSSGNKASSGVGNITTETQVASITSGNKTNTTSNNSGNKTNQSSNSSQNTQTSNNGGQTATTPSQSQNSNSNSGGTPAVNNPTPEPQQPSTPEPSTPDPGTQEPSGNDSGSSENGGGENSGGGEPAGDGGGNDSDVEYSPDID